MIDYLETLYPGLRRDIEVVDVATPLSYERYTGNWQGSSCGWLLTKQTMPMLIMGMPKTIPGLGSFYLAGQWVEPGGSVPRWQPCRAATPSSCSAPPIKSRSSPKRPDRRLMRFFCPRRNLGQKNRINLFWNEYASYNVYQL